MFDIFQNLFAENGFFSFPFSFDIDYTLGTHTNRYMTSFPTFFF